MSKGFTLIETIVVMALLASLVSLGVVSLTSSQQIVSTKSTLTQLISDIRSQQIKSQTGDSGVGVVYSPHGVFFEQNSYILFQGNTYSPSDQANLTVELDNQLVLSTSLPGDQIIFSPISGEVNDFSPTDNVLELTNTGSGEIVTLEFNRYGAIESEY